MGINGFMSQDGAEAFAVSVDGVNKNVNDSITKASDSNTTNLKIVKGADTNTLKAADNVVVQAVLAIAPTEA
ncbi:hypothetical protein L4D04_18240 [Photobacterium angustum]|uniref:hypothetical protein n=1 Tax=Photobacterium angustum TaxID=661 RepID=UPI003D0E95FD